MQQPFDIPADLFPFRSNWTEVAGIPVHYIDEGQGPVILLLHGNFMWSFSYRRLITALSKTHRCISIDLAGMGMTRMPERFSRIIIANSWAWSCHDYRASKLWSMVSPLSTRALRRFMLNKKRWLFEDRSDLENPDVWNACIAPYPNAAAFKPIAQLARELTRARPYFDKLADNMHRLADKDIQIIWSVKEGGLFPEFVQEDLFLKRWRDIFPAAPVTRVDDIGYYSLVTRPSEALLDVIMREFASGR